MPPKEYFISARLKIRKRVEQKYGPGPYTKEQRTLINREVEKKMWEKHRAQSRYQFRKIRFEKGRVRLRINGYPLRGVSITASKLIRHFTPQEIRRAAEKYLKLKEKFHI
jgi:hypothetical protein